MSELFFLRDLPGSDWLVALPFFARTSNSNDFPPAPVFCEGKADRG